MANPMDRYGRGHGGGRALPVVVGQANSERGVGSGYGTRAPAAHTVPLQRSQPAGSAYGPARITHVVPAPVNPHASALYAPRAGTAGFVHQTVVPTLVPMVVDPVAYGIQAEVEAARLAALEFEAARLAAIGTLSRGANAGRVAGVGNQTLMPTHVGLVTRSPGAPGQPVIRQVPGSAYRGPGFH